ncbi:hypothetical protein ACFU99_32375 [Streptomyces sp. NPDC057654]|uniref:hypothetical protein n=1 Tax=Streptomyces sp. NPDC057654 TaxID=3346196 RepID=UPI00368CFFA1
MSETPILDAIAADEAAVRDAGQVARDLLTAHSGLPVADVRLYRFHQAAEVHIEVPHPEGVRAWAARLDGRAVYTKDADDTRVYEHWNAEIRMAEVQVRVWHCRLTWPDDEQAAPASAAAAGGAR